MTNRHEFYTQTIGRFVSGSLTEKRTKDNAGRPIPDEDQRFEFGIAFPKDDPDMQRLFGEFWQFLSQEYQSKPQVMQMVQTWFQTLNGFSMKIQDGDKPNSKGTVNDNTKGCYVFYFSSNFAPDTVSGPAYEPCEATAIKRGYYVRVAGSIVPNGLDNHQAGIFMNPTAIQLVAKGEEIRGGVDAATAFGGSQMPGQLPPGAQPLDQGFTAPGQQQPAPPAPGMPGTVPTQPPAGAPAPGQTAPAAMPGQGGAQPPAQPQTAYPGNVQPHPDILNPPQPPAAPGQPQQQQQAAPPAAPGMPGLPGSGQQ